MSLSCLRSSDPNIRIVNQLYDDTSREGSLYSGSGTPALCSSTLRPPPSGCEVCVDRFVYAVCCELQKKVKLVMEGAGRHIDLIKSDCPGLLGDATNENADSSGNHGDAGPWWLAILLLFLLLSVIVIVLLVVFCRRRGTGTVDFSEVEPVAAV